MADLRRVIAGWFARDPRRTLGMPANIRTGGQPWSRVPRFASGSTCTRTRSASPRRGLSKRSTVCTAISPPGGSSASSSRHRYPQTARRQGQDRSPRCRRDRTPVAIGRPHRRVRGPSSKRCRHSAACSLSTRTQRTSAGCAMPPAGRTPQMVTRGSSRAARRAGLRRTRCERTSSAIPPPDAREPAVAATSREPSRALRSP
jgi:hypothetical protein